MTKDEDKPEPLSADELSQVQGGAITLDNGIKGAITLDNGIKGSITLDNGIKKSFVFEPNDKN